jgi:ABC-type nitrate/sulfonate/bicarbonate transport system substrate-binding protein
MPCDLTPGHDVDLVVMRDVWDRDPVAAQKLRRQLLDATQWLDFNFAELGEIDFGSGGPIT